ncbi:DNA-directed RNA polymerases I and III subunit RPAC2 [Nematocida minor]|uniref:DNA-directed RNA polymerases I and III subunit RPAC2 n=1 Tax=Nematocida minor TaxID=1912983 RepID=UPI002220900B|nr:DNA-directed RNA polymerases I and III subunit RPAC2 [Nematocida minor]KAI5190370.1 DNA-directed RNA polymerases I and III subunit RPAC2 [Nematocida minor]
MEVGVRDNYTIEILKTNHTVLNIVRWAIEKFEEEYEIDLIGYTIPHPMETRALMKIQLKKEEEQTKSAILSIFKRGIAASNRVLSQIEESI